MNLFSGFITNCRNFEGKFLIDRMGNVHIPDDIKNLENDIKELLSQAEN